MTDAFPRALARLAVAQLCEDAKFQGAQRSALDTLADLLLRHITEVGRAARAYSEHAGRTESNLHDVLLAFEDLSVSVPDVIRYCDAVEEIPFARAVPRLPVRKKRRRRTPSFAQLGETPPSGSIPPWLPALPEKHTYMATPMWPERKRQPKADQLEQGKERRRAEKSLVTLHERVESLPRGASDKPGTAQLLWGRVTGGARLQVSEGGVGSVNQALPSKVSEVVSNGGGKAAKPSVSDALVNPFTTQAVPETAVNLNPVLDFGYSAEDLEGTNKWKGTEEDSSHVLTVLDVFPEIIEAGRKMKQRQEDDDMDPEAKGNRGTGGEDDNLQIWSGWFVPPAKDKGTKGLSFDWSNKLKQRALEARQLYEGEEGQEERKDEKRERGREEEKDEKIRRAELIFELAEKMEKEEEGGTGTERNLME